MTTNLRAYIIPAGSFLAVLFAFAVLYGTRFGAIAFDYPLLHVGILAVAAAGALYAGLVLYRIYGRGKDVYAYATAVSFFISGIALLLHAVATPGAFFVGEDVFDVTEHYGFFIAAVCLWYFLSPFFTKHWQLYKRRGAITLSLLACVLLLFLLVFVSSAAAEALERFVDAAIALTGIFFFLSLSPTILRYKKTHNPFFLTVGTGLAVLLNIAIIPFFYEEWSLVWWYVHFVFALGFGIVFFSVTFFAKEAREIRETEDRVALPSRFSVRLTTALFILSIFPLLALYGYIFTSVERSLRDQTLHDLTVFAEGREGRVRDYVDTMRGRAANFSSDGFIRETAFAANAKGLASDVADRFESYLAKDKATLDARIIGLSVMDTKGVIVATTLAGERGEDESGDEYVHQALALPYGGTFVGRVEERDHVGVGALSIVVSAPLFSRSDFKRAGVIALYFDTSGLADAISGWGGAAATEGVESVGALGAVRSYILSSEGIAIARARETERAFVGRLFVPSVPAASCDDATSEASGVWTNPSSGARVLGARSCVMPFGWSVIVEEDEDHALAPLFSLRRTMFIILALTILLLILAGIYFSNRLSRPLEELTRVARRLNDGDVSARADASSKDEIGMLGRVFNAMTESFVQANKKLSAKSEDLMEKVRLVAAQSENLSKTKRAILNLLEDSKDLEDRLRRKKGQMDAVIGAIAEGVIVLKNDLTVLRANPAAEQIYGVAALGMKRKKLTDFGVVLKDGKEIAPDERPAARTIRENKTIIAGLEDNYAIKTPSGRVTPVAMATTPLAVDGTVVGAVIAIRDITAEKQFDESRNSFISVASHQLRTPLTSMRWYIEMIQAGDAGPLTPEQTDFLAEAYKGILRLTDTLDTLLALSRIESGRTKVEAKEIALHDFMLSTVKELDPLLKEKGIALTCDCVESYKPVVTVDPTLLRQVVTNLLANAIRYTEKGGKIAVRLAPENGGVICAVKDDGIGIPDEYKDKVFEKFFRAENAVSKVPEGNGLGLNLVKSLVEMWKGRVWFVSPAEWKEGGKVIKKGTEFYFTIPSAVRKDSPARGK